MPQREDKQAALDQLVSNIQESKKYRDVSASVIRSIGQRELHRRATLKEAIKATRNKLHQVGSAYLPNHLDYTVWLEELEVAAQSGDSGELRRVCQRIMANHASTRERLPILEELYGTILSDLAPIHSVLDIACGLNPLAIPWMPLAEDSRYYAFDIYQDMIDFLDKFMLLAGIQGKAYTGDASADEQVLADQQVDVALILKAIPCLEQIDKQAGSRLLQSVKARYVVVSFPIYSLGGHHKGMAKHYEEHFLQLIEHQPWTAKKYTFASELAFVIDKRASSQSQM